MADLDDPKRTILFLIFVLFLLLWLLVKQLIHYFKGMVMRDSFRNFFYACLLTGLFICFYEISYDMMTGSERDWGSLTLFHTESTDCPDIGKDCASTRSILKNIKSTGTKEEEEHSMKQMGRNRLSVDNEGCSSYAAEIFQKFPEFLQVVPKGKKKEYTSKHGKHPLTEDTLTKFSFY